MTLSTFLGKKLLPPKTPKTNRRVFRQTMKLYNGNHKWELVKNVRVSGEMYNGRKTYEYDGYDPDKKYIMFRDKFNGEYLTTV